MRKSHVVVLNSLISYIIVILAVSTPITRIVYGFAAFWLAFIFQMLLIEPDSSSDNASLRLGGIKRREWFPFMLLVGVLVSICFLAIPQTRIEVYSDAMYISLLGSPIAESMRIVFGIILLCFFPGYVICKCLIPEKYALGAVGTICLSLALSYCFSVVDGLILVATIGLSELGFVASIWILTIAAILLKRYTLCQRVQSATDAYGRDSSFSKLLLFCTCAVILFGSYFSLLVTGPLGGYLSGDIPRYSMYSNEFLNYSSVVQPYVWLQTYLRFFGLIVGLPFLYSYVILQFYNLLIPLSFYLLVRRISPQSSRIAAIATFMVSLLQGMSALGFWWALTNPNVLNAYFGGQSYEVLDNYLTQKIGIGTAPIYILAASTIDIGMFLLAIYFALIFLNEKEGRIPALILSALFINIALFTHSILLPLCYVTTIALYLLFKGKPLRSLVVITLCVLAFFFLFDIISKGWFTSIFLGYYIIIVSSFYVVAAPSLSDVFLFLVIIAAFILVPIVYRLLKPKIADRARRLLRGFSHSINLQNQWKYLPIIALHVFVFALIACLLDYQNVNVIYAWFQSYLYPWYVFVLAYGLTLPISIAMFHFILRKHKRSLFFVFSWLLSLLLIASISLAIGYQEELITNRSLVYVIFPLSLLAALGIHEFFKNPRSRNAGLSRKKELYTTMLICMITISFLSYTYITQGGFLAASHVLSDSEQESINWINGNVTAGDVVFPTSQYSYRLLCSLTLAKVLPLMEPISPSAPYSWVHDLLLSTRLPQDAMYILQKLGVTYIYSRNEDISLLGGRGLTSLLNSLPIVHENKNIRIYGVPRNSSYHPPYPEDLFKFIIPSLNVLWSLDELHGCIIYYSDIVMFGGVALTSDVITEDCSYLPVSSLSVITPYNGTLSYSSTDIYDVRIQGQGTLISGMCRISSSNSAYDFVSLSGIHQVLNLTGATVQFRLNGNITVGPFSDSVLSLETLGLSNVSARAPVIRSNGGRVGGMLEGSFFYQDRFFYQLAPHELTFKGNFTLSLKWSSGPILARIDNATEIEAY